MGLQTACVSVDDLRDTRQREHAGSLECYDARSPIPWGIGPDEDR